ncbi:MAG: hypothetical protein AB7T22_10885 [Calditrichaceae bacterium]
MRRILFCCIILMVILFHTMLNAAEIRRDENAPGARAAMGLFANAYSKSLTTNVFGLEPLSLKGRLGSLVIAAAGYQLISYDTMDGIQLNPFTFRKEWHGYWEGYLGAEGLDIFLRIVRKYDGAKFIVASTVLISMGIIVANGEDGDGWRNADDSPLTLKNLFKNRDSYWIHFAGSGGLFWAISNHTVSKESALIYTASLVWLWEIKDGYLKWEDAGFIGGDGFSWRDGTAGTIAVFGSYAVSKWIFPRIKRVIGNLGVDGISTTADKDGFRLLVRFDLP